MTRSVRRAVACLAAGLLMFSMPAFAARIEISGGRSETLLPYLYTNVVFLEWIGTARPWWHITWAPEFAIGYVAARSATPRARLDNDVWLAAAGARAYLWRDLFFAFQVATTAGKTDALSTPYEFVSSIGWQGGHWQILARHISNGDFHEPNHGETMLLVGVAF